MLLTNCGYISWQNWNSAYSVYRWGCCNCFLICFVVCYRPGNWNENWISIYYYILWWNILLNCVFKLSLMFIVWSVMLDIRVRTRIRSFNDLLPIFNNGWTLLEETIWHHQWRCHIWKCSFHIGHVLCFGVPDGWI